MFNIRHCRPKVKLDKLTFSPLSERKDINTEETIIDTEETDSKPNQ